MRAKHLCVLIHIRTKGEVGIVKHVYTTFTNFSTKYLAMCKVYTDVGGIK